MIRRPPSSPLFPYPTLFRSLAAPIAYDTNVKMNPPLRETADRDAMLAGLRDGSIDVIATDHAPHHADEKQVEFDRAPFGITGLDRKSTRLNSSHQIISYAVF